MENLTQFNFKENPCELSQGRTTVLQTNVTLKTFISNERYFWSRFSCGKSGHISRDCPSEQKGRGGGGGGACYECGEEGHLARDCPDKPRGGGGGGRGGACYECGEEGHLARDCPDRD